MLDYRGFRYVHVNCAEAVAKRGLLEAVLEQAAGSRYADVQNQLMRDDACDFLVRFVASFVLRVSDFPSSSFRQEAKNAH